MSKTADTSIEAARPDRFTALRTAYDNATYANWQWGSMLKRDGALIVTNKDVAETVAFSAMRSERGELWGVTLPIADGEDAAVVVCYTGNGPNAHNNAHFIAMAQYHVPALLDAVDGLRSALRAIVDLPGELNMANYNHDDVQGLNDAFLEAYQIATDALAKATAS